VAHRYKILRILGKTLGWIGRHIQAVLLWFGLVVTLCGAFFFLPRVTVEPSGPYDPSHPSPITFTITNANIVALRNVQPFIGICSVRLAPNLIAQGPTKNCIGGSTGALLYQPWFTHWLGVDEKYQIAIEDVLKLENDSPEQIQEAEITIGVIYTPYWMPTFWRNTKEFRFITKKRSDGKIYWVPTPLNP
jgi:hypothetical protein